MAFIHTNYLTGNDTTGTGSTGAPYKTVGKALSVAVSNDFIKVAGGQWTALTGDFTFTNNSTTVTTSVSQVGSLNVDDVITFEDGQFGFDKFHYRVTGVTGANITLATAWAGPTQVSSAVSKLGTFHYSDASTTGSVYFETWNPAQTNPLGRTGITISGGWNSDYTSNANGWTGARYTADGAGVYLFRTSGGSGNLGDWKANLILDRFLGSKLQSVFQFTYTTNKSTTFNTFALKELSWVTPGGASMVLVDGQSTYGAGVYNVDSNTPCTLYLNGIAVLRNINVINTSSNATYAGASSLTNWTLYCSAAGANPTQASASGPGLVTNNIGGQGSSNRITLHLRSATVTPGTAFYGSMPNIYGFNSQGQGSQYTEKIIFYANTPQTGPWVLSSIAVSGTFTTSNQIEDIEITGPYAADTCISFNNLRGQTLIDLSQEGKLIEDFNPCIIVQGQTGGAVGLQSSFTFSYLAGQNLNAIQIKDAEGLKTADTLGNIYFKDFTNGWLRIRGGGAFANDLFNYDEYPNSWKVIGVKEKPQAPFTVTLRLKDDGNGGDWNTIAVQYGPGNTQIITESVSLTTSFQDYYITVDPTAYSDWNLYNFPIFIGISAKCYNFNSNNQQATNCYVESITIS